LHAAPILLNRAATLDKVMSLAEKAAADGAQLVAFPEAFVPGYPGLGVAHHAVHKHASAP